MLDLGGGEDDDPFTAKLMDYEVSSCIKPLCLVTSAHWLGY